MQVDALAVALRPRPMMEACDLGTRLVQRHAASVWGSVLPVYLPIAAIALGTVEIAGWLPAFIIFWLKPWLDRSVLFVLSRSVFGEPTRFADLWHAQGEVWWRHLVSTLTLRRLSPWRSFTQAAHQLEGQRGSALNKRKGQLLRGRRGVGFLMHSAFANIEAIFVFGLFALALWFEPDWQRRQGMVELFGHEGSVSLALASSLAYAAVVMVVEPFYVASGFAMYLNRRVELEAWDIEQEFRRAFDA